MLEASLVNILNSRPVKQTNKQIYKSQTNQTNKNQIELLEIESIVILRESFD